MGTLYLVATPIGNLEDISARALRILREAALVAAEDTRHTQKLLNHFGIAAQTISYHEHNKLKQIDRLLTALQSGDVALVSDAGTPALNDPGYELVQAVLAAGFNVSPVPGASAPLAALVASGLPTENFLYLGYLPRHSRERRQLLEQVRTLPYTLIFLETPHRLLAGLADLLAVLGDRPAAAARELTKLHEQFVRASLAELLAHFQHTAPRGEFTLVVGGCPPALPEPWSAERLQQALPAALDSGEPLRQAAAALAKSSGWNSREIYRLLLAAQEAARRTPD